ncbi:MAG: signal peptidase I, partial [Rhodanobacteraceae bacterium]
MKIDFASLLLVLIAVTGAVWLVDALVFARSRTRPGVLHARLGKARRARAAEQSYRRPLAVETARTFLPVLVLILGVRTCLAEPFKIPSGSMMPTLLVGDYILVNKFSYGVRLPVLNTKVVDVGMPARGDLVVFRPPWAPDEHWIKRVIGLPGDEITYRNKTLYINGEQIAATDVGPYVGAPEPNRSMSGAEVKTEQLGPIAHPIMEFPNQHTDHEGSWIVPTGQYFMMGDSRDNSIDSRF